MAQSTSQPPVHPLGDRPGDPPGPGALQRPAHGRRRALTRWLKRIALGAGGLAIAGGHRLRLAAQARGGRRRRRAARPARRRGRRGRPDPGPRSLRGGGADHRRRCSGSSSIRAPRSPPATRWRASIRRAPVLLDDAQPRRGHRAARGRDRPPAPRRHRGRPRRARARRRGARRRADPHPRSARRDRQRPSASAATTRSSSRSATSPRPRPSARARPPRPPPSAPRSARARRDPRAPRW